jgi:hypothetical protein
LQSDGGPYIFGKDVLVGCTYAGAESIRISRAIDENVYWRSIDSIARRERQWCNSLCVRGFARWLGNPSGTCSGNIYNDGRPIIWFLNILPIVAIFLVINVAWAVILARRQWNGGRFWLLAAVVWLAAVVIDFAHH